MKLGFGDLEKRQAPKSPEEEVLARESLLAQSQFAELTLHSCDNCAMSSTCPHFGKLQGLDGGKACYVKKFLGDDALRRINLRDPVNGFIDITKELWKEYEFEKFRCKGVLSKKALVLAKIVSDNVDRLQEKLGDPGNRQVDLSWLLNRKKSLGDSK